MSTKDFRQGMVAGAKPFGDKLDQLATASETGVNDIKEGLDDVTGIVSTVLDDLSIQEKKRIYDLDEATDISMLEDDEKEFLVAVLMELANIVENTSELQKKYLSSICNVTGIANPQTYVDLSYIENIESNKTQKILLRHIMEFLFIGTGNYSFLDDYDDDVFSYFSVNKRGFNEIKAIIDRINTAMGVDGIANRYTFISGYEKLLAQEEKSSKELQDESFQDVEEDVPTEFEDICIDNILQIGNEETKVFKYKNIHIKSIINCAGTLELDNCVIYYNEFGYSDEITFEENSSFVAKDCIFICNDLDENYFITFAEKCNATFENCIFKDCSYFIQSPSLVTFSMKNCRLENCGRKFFRADDWLASEGGKCNIETVSIENDELASFNTLNKGAYESDIYLFKVNMENCVVKNVHIKGKQGVEYFENYFDICNGLMINSTFENAKRCVKALGIEECLFKNCIQPVFTSENREYRSNVKSCVFSNCFDSINAERDTTITQCKFLECKNSIIYNNFSGSGIEISFCEFINCKNNAEDHYQKYDSGDPEACISLSYSKRGNTHIIKKCVFDGIDVNEGFLIKSKIYEKVTSLGVIVSECDFRNCSTKRTSGKIIKTMATYCGLFDSIKTVQVVRVENCRGLDKINKQSSVCSDAKKTAVTSIDGKTVGVANAVLIGTLLAQTNIKNESSAKKESVSIFEIQEVKGKSFASIDYKGVVKSGSFHKEQNVKLISQNKEIGDTHIHWLQKRYPDVEYYYVSETVVTNDVIIISLPLSAPELKAGDQIVNA